MVSGCGTTVKRLEVQPIAKRGLGFRVYRVYVSGLRKNVLAAAVAEPVAVSYSQETLRSSNFGVKP